MTCKPHSRQSHLTFAVVWDPETGLEAYSGSDLRSLRPISDEYDFPESIYSQGSPAVDNESVIFCDTDESISVSGCPRTHIIDPHAPCVCERYTFGLDDSVSQSSSKSSSTNTSSFSPSHTQKFAKSFNPPSTSTRPSSKWTFAALWDQKTGLSAFSQGKLAKFIPSTKWPSSSASGSAPNAERHSYGYIENVKRGFYLRVLPELGSHSTALSSPVEGHQHEPHFSCFDPLNELLLFEPHLHPFPQSASGPAKKDNHLLGAATMDDDYVMKGDEFSHTSDPYLPSRFSTSTSGYVPISPTSVHVIPPITFLGSRSSASRSTRKRGKLSRSKSAGLRHETECTIPRLFKNAPWSKGSEDGKWVLVEVQSVVTDRVVDEL